ncbi:MAG TPA: hypothetical protein VIX80_07955 [Candidatus Kapabacteria bacterium]
MKTLLLVILLSSQSFAQAKTPLMVFGSLFTPKGYIEGYQLRDLIRSDVYTEETEGMTDREKLDYIYNEAYILSRGDFQAAQLASAVATLEHRTIEIKLLFGASITLPLTFEPEESFTARVERLPSRIYSDSTEDKDKMQHFFLSAYLKRTLGTNSLVRLLGSFVEAGEDAFIVGGVSDERDLHANEEGISFATSDERAPISKPSEYLGTTTK